jgi:hypothetical protein
MVSKVEGKRQKTGGRKAGTPNKVTGLLKDAIIQAATNAGGGDLVNYLQTQATANPGPFLGLVGKVLPMQVTGEGDGPVKLEITWQSKG